MLYDPKWSKKPSLKGFISWLETKKPSGKYDFSNCTGGCLMGEYMAYLGDNWHELMPEGSQYTRYLNEVFGDSITAHEVLADFPQTYGAVLERTKVKLSV